MTGAADELDEIVGEFLVESHENLDRLDQQLVELEQHPDPETIASIFRTIHTIKGTSGFLGFGTLERVTCCRPTSTMPARPSSRGTGHRSRLARCWS